MTALMVLIFIVAAAAWLVAAKSLLALVGMAPSGTRFATLNDLGWWRFGSIEARIGHQAHASIARYRNAFLVFFLCVLAGTAAVLVTQLPNTAASG